MRVVLLALGILSLFLRGSVEARSCAPRCDYVLCDEGLEEKGLVQATVLSVVAGEYPENPTYDRIDVEIVAMFSDDGNADWVGKRFTLDQAGWLETAEGDSIAFWVPDRLQDGSELSPEIYLLEGEAIACHGLRASASAVANAADHDSCLAAFTMEDDADEYCAGGCSASRGGMGCALWLAAIASLMFLRRGRNAL